MQFLEGDPASWEDVPWAETWLRDVKLPSKFHSSHKQLQRLKHPSSFVGDRILFADGEFHYYVHLKAYIQSGGQGSTFSGIEEHTGNAMILKLIPVPPGRSIKNLAEISSEASFVDVLNDIKAALPPGIDIIERPVSATLANGYIAFEAYKTKHNKLYATIVEHNQRYNNFCESKARIARMNQAAIKAGVSTRFAINKFSDLTQEEFRAKFTGMKNANNLGKKMSRETLGQNIVQSCLTNGITSQRLPTGNLPPAFDWNQQGKVSPVKDQGQCGSCWTFSTTGCIESQFLIKYNKNILLSEQAVVDCSTACSNVTGYGPVCNQGCNGGWPWAAMADVKTWGGLPTEAVYPYTAETGTCHMKGMALNGPIANVTCVSGPNAAQETQMQAWLVNHGPLSIAINADPLQDYSSGVITPGWEYGKCGGKQLDHAVLLVGYGTEKGIISNTDFWNVKNSWGASWGEKGYFRLQRGVNLCGISEAVTAIFLQ